METQINGIAASDGVGIAPAYLLTKPNLNFEKYHISDPNSEKARLHRAFDKIIHINFIDVCVYQELGGEDF